MSLTPSTATGVTAIPAGTYAIDPSHSEVSFVARHAMVTKVRGYFRDVSGEITVGEDFATSSATAVMQTASVDSGSADRDTHLKSADFFDVENNPEITFASTGLRKIEDDEFVLDGDLTISGITKPVSLEVEYEGVAQDPARPGPLGRQAGLRSSRTTTANAVSDAHVRHGIRAVCPLGWRLSPGRAPADPARHRR